MKTDRFITLYIIFGFGISLAYYAIYNIKHPGELNNMSFLEKVDFLMLEIELGKTQYVRRGKNVKEKLKRFGKKIVFITLDIFTAWFFFLMAIIEFFFFQDRRK